MSRAEAKAQTRAEAKAQTRDRLLDAALEILEADGSGELTTTEVTRRAGIAQSGFYTHFTDMEELLCQLIERVGRERRRASAAAIRAARPGSPVDRVRDGFRETVFRTAAYPNLYRLLLRSRLDPHSRVGEEARRQRAETRRNVLGALKASGIRMGTASEKRRARMMADALVGASQELILAHLDGRTPDIEELLDVYLLFALGVPSAARRRANA